MPTIRISVFSIAFSVLAGHASTSMRAQDASAASKTDTAVTSQAARAESVRFAWPVPGSVVVTERALKKGKAAVMRYRVETKRALDGKSIVVSLRNFEFLEVAGRDATTPAMKKALSKTLVAAASIPDFRVAPDGSFTGATNFEPTIEALARLQRLSPAQTAAMKKQFARPVVVQALAQSIAKFWNCWVGAWTSWTLAPGKSRSSEAVLSLGAAPLPAVVVARHLGPSKALAGGVSLEIRTIAAGDKAKKAFASFMTEFAGKRPGSKGLRAEDLKRLRVETVARVETRLRDLRPVSAMVRTESTVHEVGKKLPQVSVEERRYSFDWGATKK